MRRSPMLVLLIIVLSIYYWEVAQYAILGLALLYIAKILFGYSRLLYVAIRNYTLNDIDAMDGVEFERYVARQLSRLGYTNITLTEEYDYGVDIVASKDGIRWGIQVKRYSGLVKADVVLVAEHREYFAVLKRSSAPRHARKDSLLSMNLWKCQSADALLPRPMFLIIILSIDY